MEPFLATSVMKWPFYGHFMILVKKVIFSNCNIEFDFTALIFKPYMVVLGLYTYYKLNFHNMVQKKIPHHFSAILCHFCHFHYFDRHDYSAFVNISPLLSYQNIMVWSVLLNFEPVYCHKWHFFAIFKPKMAMKCNIARNPIFSCQNQNLRPLSIVIGV